MSKDTKTPAKVVAQTRIAKFIEKPLALILKQLTGLGIDDHVTTVEAQVLALKGVIDSLPDDVKKRRTDRVPAPTNGEMQVISETLGEPIEEAFLDTNTALSELQFGKIYETHLPEGQATQVLVDGPSVEPGKFACRYMDASQAIYSIDLEPKQLGRCLN